jgi:hypothetical protein
MRNTTSDRGPAQRDQYRIAEYSEAPQAAKGESSLLRTSLWLLLVVSGACNVITSSTELPVLVGIGFGLLTLALGTALAADHYRRRRR